MTASKNRIEDFARRASRLPLAPIAGAMLGGAVAFLCLMTPVWMLERFSANAGLPAFLAAAAPPLGMKARLLVAILGGGTAFLVGTILVALFDRSARPRPRKPTMIEELIEPEMAEPASARQRTFSAAEHEAAERAPRPILATRELGVPMDEVVEDRPLAWLQPAEEESVADDVEAIAIPSHLSRSAVTEDQDRAPAAFDEDDWLDLGAFPIADAAPEDMVAESAFRRDAVPPPPVATPAEVQSVPALMARLEAGLVKRGLGGNRLNGVGHSEMTRTGPAPVKVKPPLDMDAALRKALQELHRVAGRA